MNESAKASLVGRLIAGKFLIESLIGVGAMGAVYKARQIALDKAIAIKVMHPERASDAMYASLFQREARAASRLDHPNSVRVVDFGQEPDGLLYIAMEYFAGRDLSHVLAEDWPLCGTRIADILSQALAAIAVAHEMGMVHRDLKPENILVQNGHDDEGAPHDVVKVCDFGIAKFTEQLDVAHSRAAPRLTEGVVIGTPHYMSPEQGQGGTLDARSDIYSIGVILYQMLTSSVPFEGKTLVDVVIKHVRDEPVPPATMVPGVDPRLESICLKALRKKKEERYQSAREMRGDLRAVLAAPAPIADLPRRQVSRDASTMPPAPREHGPGGSERTASKVTLPPTASAAGPKRKRPGVGAAVVAAILAMVGATALLVRLSHPGTVNASSAPQSPTVPLEGTAPPSASASESDHHHPQIEAPAPSPVQTPPPHEHEPPKAVSKPNARTAPRTSPQPTEPIGPLSVDTVPPTPPPPPPALVVPSPAAPVAPPPVTTTVVPKISNVAPAPRPFDPSGARVDWSVTATGGGATAAEARRAFAHTNGAWNACYQNGLRTGGKPAEGSGVLHVVTDEVGNVVSASLAGFSMSGLGSCIAASTSVRIAGVDTGSAWADIRLQFRAGTQE